MRILLINPPATREETYSAFSFVAPNLPPLGLGYMAAYLRRAGHHVEIVDAVSQGVTEEGVRAIVQSTASDIVGVTATTIAFPRAKRVLAMVKSVRADALTLAGGPHISAIPEAVMKECPQIDIGVFGEGEETVVEIADRLGRGGPLTDIEGTAVRRDGAIALNPGRSLIQDLDRLPFPARDLFKEDVPFRQTPLRGRGRVCNLVTSRGCPYKCRFCDQSVFGSRWRGHSAASIAAEVDQLRGRYGAGTLSFEDDNFNLKRSRTLELCERLARLHSPIEWGCSLRIERIDMEVLTAMRAAGCRLIYIGLEHGEEEILKLLGKEVDLPLVLEKIRMARSAGIRVYSSFMVGVPGETARTAGATLGLALSLPLDGASFNLFTPYPGTPLARDAETCGTVRDSWETYPDHANHASFIPRDLSEAELVAIQRRAYRRFYARPGFLLRHPGLVLNSAILKNIVKLLKLFVFPGDRSS